MTSNYWQKKIARNPAAYLPIRPNTGTHGDSTWEFLGIGGRASFDEHIAAASAIPFVNGVKWREYRLSDPVLEGRFFETPKRHFKNWPPWSNFRYCELGMNPVTLESLDFSSYPYGQQIDLRRPSNAERHRPGH